MIPAGRTEKRLADAADEVRAAGGTATPIVSDATSESEMIALFDRHADVVHEQAIKTPGEIGGDSRDGGLVISQLAVEANLRRREEPADLHGFDPGAHGRSLGQHELNVIFIALIAGHGNQIHEADRALRIRIKQPHGWVHRARIPLWLLVLRGARCPRVRAGAGRGRPTEPIAHKQREQDQDDRDES